MDRLAYFNRLVKEKRYRNAQQKYYERYVLSKRKEIIKIARQAFLDACGKLPEKADATKLSELVKKPSFKYDIVDAPSGVGVASEPLAVATGALWSMMRFGGVSLEAATYFQSAYEAAHYIVDMYLKNSMRWEIGDGFADFVAYCLTKSKHPEDAEKIRLWRKETGEQIADEDLSKKLFELGAKPDKDGRLYTNMPVWRASYELNNAAYIRMQHMAGYNAVADVIGCESLDKDKLRQCLEKPDEIDAKLKAYLSSIKKEENKTKKPKRKKKTRSKRTV